MAKLGSPNPLLVIRPFIAARDTLRQLEREQPATLAAAQQVLGGALILDGLIGSANPIRARRKAGVVGSAFLIFFGAIFFGFGLLLQTQFHVDDLSGSVTGTVVDVKHNITTDSDGDKSESCDVVADYVVKGEKYRGTSVIGGGFNCGYQIGQTTELKYNPDKPTIMETPNSLGGLNFAINLLKIVGGLIILSGIWGVLVKTAAIVLGIVLFVRGRMLAKRYPAATDMAELKENVKTYFLQRVWGIR